MNLLLIGPYRQSDGWGYATQSYIKALMTTDAELVIRPVYLGQNITNNIPDELVKLENKRLSHYDAVLQKVLPHVSIYNRKFGQNVLMFTTETQRLNYTSWISRTNLMDKAFLVSQFECDELKKNGVNIPLYNIREPIDTEITQKYYLPLPLPPRTKSSFKFYFIGENNDRKNLAALLKAFYLEFDNTEDVTLVIKTNDTEIQKKVNNIKKGLRKYHQLDKYNKILHITDHLSFDQLCALHQQCDCLVMPSRGEAFCRPVAEAMLFGNAVIVTNNTAMTDYVNNSNGWVVNSSLQPVFTRNPPIGDIYTGYERWAEIDLLDLMKCMREAYEASPEKIQAKSLEAVKTIQDYSYKSVGEKIIQCLKL